MIIFNLLIFFQMIFIVSSISTDEDFQQNLGLGSMEAEGSEYILLPSSAQLQFIKSVNIDKTVNVTYDCSLGTEDKGIIRLADDFYPPRVKYITIQNCSNITVNFSLSYSQKDRNYFEVLQMLKIRNISSLTFNKLNIKGKFFKPYDIIIDVANVKFLNIKENTFEGGSFSNNKTTLKIQDVDYAHFEKMAIISEISKFYMEDVKKVVIERNSIYLNNLQAVLVIKNSDFEIIENEGLIFEGSQVEIFNNFFRELPYRSIRVKANTRFTFANNSIKNLQNSFEIIGPNVQIVSNFFDIISAPWLPNIIITSQAEPGILNITKNIMNILPPEFFSMNPESRPDFVLFKNNYFNCSCKFWNVINHSDSFPSNAVQKMLLYENEENFCLNLENCALPKVFTRMSELCQGRFICDQEKKADDTLGTHLTAILSTLNVISQQLDILITEKNSSKELNFNNSTASDNEPNF